MTKLTSVAGEYFFGNRISQYGIDNGYVDYGTLAKAINIVLNNDIWGMLDFEPFSGDCEEEVFQWYITDSNGAEILSAIGEDVWYCRDADMYLWGVTHWGTSWDYVLTSVQCMKKEER